LLEALLLLLFIFFVLLDALPRRGQRRLEALALMLRGVGDRGGALRLFLVVGLFRE
jgi:hypothetical protein